jgi:ubiquinone/menaquinone biosynthesis C-methylase UbiE
MPGRVDYTDTASGYDQTRGASPSVLEPLRRCLSTAPGRRLLDVGGGTGNYAAALRETDDFDPVVLDASEAMVERATAKGLAAIAGEAEKLPFRAASFDAVTMISMLHQVVGWQQALAEAKRVLVPGGRLAVKVFTRENLRSTAWVFDYFPSAREWTDAEHQSADELRAELPQARLLQVRYADVVDGTLAALCRDPERLLDEGNRRNNSFFRRLQRDNPGELAIGLADMWRDLAGGRKPHEEPELERPRRLWGDALILCWTKPGGARRGRAG